MGVVGPAVERAHSKSAAATGSIAPARRASDLSQAQYRSRRRDAVYRRLLASADVLSFLLALWVGVVLVGGEQLRLGVIPMIALAVVAAKLMRLYDRDATRLHKSTLDEFPGLFELATFMALVSYIGHEAIATGALSAGAAAVIWGTLFVGLIVSRAGARGLADRLTPVERCLVFADDRSASELRITIHAQNIPAEIVSVVSPNRADGDGVVETLLPIIAQREIDRVILDAGSWEADDLLHSVEDLSGIGGVKVSVLPSISRIASLSFDPDQLPGTTLMGMRRFEMTRSSLFVKRIFDVAVTTVALAVLSPLLIAIAIAIKLDSRGPLLFHQVRVGRGGREFKMAKFRSMVDGADQHKNELYEQITGNGGLFKLEDDPRITRVGKLIRSCSLDELPQLINVMRGEMSLVGPRPLIPVEDAMIQGPYRRRLEVRPGITGHWQILGSLRVPLDQMITLDYLYVANWSLWTDLKLILRTIPYLAARRNA